MISFLSVGDIAGQCGVRYPSIYFFIHIGYGYGDIHVQVGYDVFVFRTTRVEGCIAFFYIVMNTVCVGDGESCIGDQCTGTIG